MKRIHFFAASILFLLTADLAFAQVTALGTGRVKESNSNTNSLVMDNFEVPIGNDVLLIVATRNADVVATNMSFNGNALTKLNGVTNGAGNSSIWYRVLGNVTTPITANLQMTLSNSSQTKMMAARCFKNVLQSNPLSGFTSNTFTNTATSSTLNNTGSVGDMVFDVISSIGTTSTPPTFTGGAGQTIIGTGISSSQPKRRILASYKPLASASTNMSWTVSGSTGGLGIHLSTRIQSASVLPVELIGFAATQMQEGILLNWKTASESNNESFSVQRSLDSRNWKELGLLIGAGTTQELQSYEFTDKTPAIGLNYYRLVQKGFDGKTSFSPAVSTRRTDKGATVSISPNPWSGGPCEIIVCNLLEHQGTLEVIDHQGKLVYQKEVSFSDLEKSVISIDTSVLTNGHCFVRLITKSRRYNCRLLVQSL